MNKYEPYDVVVVGTGPAGLQAAIHASRKKVSVLVLGKEHKSSLFRAHVENMLCLFNATTARKRRFCSRLWSKWASAEKADRSASC
jgi:thioredoxin reductase